MSRNPSRLEFVPGFYPDPSRQSVETLPKLKRPDGSALLLSGYIGSAPLEQTLEERNALGAELGIRYNAHVALVVMAENAERRAKQIGGMDPNDSRIPLLLREQQDEAARVLALAKGGVS